MTLTKERIGKNSDSKKSTAENFSLKGRLPTDGSLGNLRHLRVIPKGYLEEIESLDIGEEAFGSKIDMIVSIFIFEVCYKEVS